MNKQDAGRQVKRRFARCGPLRALLRRRCLAGEDSFIAFQFISRKQTYVGRYHVAHIQPHDVSGHQLRDVDLDRVSVADRRRGVTDARVERLYGASSAILVQEPEPDAKRDDTEDNGRVRRFTNDERCCRGSDQEN